MKVIVTLRAEKSPKDEEEKAFLAEIQANGKLDQWRREAEDALRAMMKSELDDPDLLEVSVTIDEEDEEDEERCTCTTYCCGQRNLPEGQVCKESEGAAANEGRNEDTARKYGQHLAKLTGKCGMCDGTGRTARYGRQANGEPPIVREPCPRCTKEAVSCLHPIDAQRGNSSGGHFCGLCGTKLDPRATHDDHPDADCNCPACR